MTGDIWEYLKPRQAAVERELQSRLDRHAADTPTTLVEAMGYSLLAPGKRLRPLLCVLAAEAVGGSFECALAAGCAVEMVHTYSLIHDDLPAMDDDDLRRGRPTCHVKFGEAMAILAGDALLTMAFEVLGNGYVADVAAVACVELARGAGAAGMVGGQVLDLAANSDLEAIHRRKTGALIRSAMRLGVLAGGRKEFAAIDAYAEAFGLLFQVTDDLLDVQSSAETTGKRVGKDAERGKLTYPVIHGVEQSREIAARLSREAVAAAEGFGPRGAPLAELAKYVVSRDR